MGCIFGIIGFFFPRIVIVVLALSTHYFSTAYNNILWPILGFFFAPFTTLAYAFAINSRGNLGGWHLGLFILAILMDVGVVGGAKSKIKKRRQEC